MAIPQLKKDPSPILPLLENLKADESLFVRKSVANNLNDIAKDHPDLVAKLVKSWKGHRAETDWIISASRLRTVSFRVRCMRQSFTMRWN